MNDINLSAILFYADFLSLKDLGIPVTDNCKYFFIHEQPVNAAFIVGSCPFYDEHNTYILLAKFELDKLKDYCEEDGMMSVVNNIGILLACGMCDGPRLISYIHQYSSKYERKSALKKYIDYVNSLEYTKTTINEDGNPQQTTCTKYYAHAEKMCGRSRIPQSV